MRREEAEEVARAGGEPTRELVVGLLDRLESLLELERRLAEMAAA
jgi:hypothetical protein